MEIVKSRAQFQLKVAIELSENPRSPSSEASFWAHPLSRGVCIQKEVWSKFKSYENIARERKWRSKIFMSDDEGSHL